MTPAAAISTRATLPWTKLAWFALLLLACFAPVFYALVASWWNDPDMGHAWFVPAVAGYLVWQRRHELLEIAPRPNWWGLAVVLFGGCQLIAATLGVELFLARTAILIILIGIVWLLGGTAILKKLAFPLVLLFFMVPIPTIVYTRITFPLQIKASQFAEWSLTALDIPVVREGNILELPRQKLSVVEACSGIRSLLTLTFLSLVYGHFFERRVWLRALLFLATIPIAILANGSRVAITGILTQVKPDLAEGFFHESTGIVTFLAAVAILFLFHQAVAFVSRRLEATRGKWRGSAAQGERGEPTQPQLPTPNPPPPFFRALTLVLLLQGGVYYAVASRSELTPPARPLALFPSRLEGWAMRQDFPIDPEVQQVLKADDTLDREYVNSSGTADVIFFVAFFKTQRYGQSPHSPKNCLPGAGFEPVENSTIRIAVPQWNSPIEVNKYVTERGDEKSVTLYWYQGHNRIIASEYAARFWLVMDAIRFRRSDTSIVKVVVPIIDNRFDAATATGMNFIRAMFPALLKVLPS